MQIGEDNNNVVVDVEPQVVHASGLLPSDGDTQANGATLKKVLAQKGTIVVNIDFDDEDVFDKDAKEARVDRLVDSLLLISILVTELLVSLKRASPLVSFAFCCFFFII